jgi:uncharacterized protein with von Willebrand factor type A (vWA) domain
MSIVRGADDAGEAAPAKGKREGASRFETLAATDFRKLADPDEIAAAHAAARLAQAMRTHLTRRERPARRGRRIDLRRTIHRQHRPWRHADAPGLAASARHKPLRLVVLLDASGSMSMYTGVFLRFIHGVLDNFREAEAFLFHTRLVHVSDALRERDRGACARPAVD